MSMDQENKSSKILKGIEPISRYCGFSKAIFSDVVADGLPVRLWKGIWWAHTDNLDEYFKRFTMVRNSRPLTAAELVEEETE